MITGYIRAWPWAPGAAAGIALLLALGGCASTGSTAETTERRDVLTSEQIMSAEVSNLYDVVRRLRPEWLRTKGQGGTGRLSGETRIVVIQNNTVVGGVETLRDFSPEGVQRLRYTEGETAAATLVGGEPGIIEGAIIVEIGG